MFGHILQKLMTATSLLRTRREVKRIDSPIESTNNENKLDEQYKQVKFSFNDFEYKCRVISVMEKLFNDELEILIPKLLISITHKGILLSNELSTTMFIHALNEGIVDIRILLDMDITSKDEHLKRFNINEISSIVSLTVNQYDNKYNMYLKLIAYIPERLLYYIPLSSCHRIINSIKHERNFEEIKLQSLAI